MNKHIFFTLNPHINNLSKSTLINNFNDSLKRFYREKLGPRYYKHKDKQYLLSVTIENGKRVIKEPHLHMIIQNHDNLAVDLCVFIMKTLNEIYKSLTFDIQSVGNEPLDYIKTWSYALKEDNGLITNQDLYSKDYIR